jgi:hypothetical protein
VLQHVEPVAIGPAPHLVDLRGLIVKGSSDAALFLGFDAMPFREGREKFDAIIRRCRMN